MTGKLLHMRRLFREDGRAMVVALDHAQFKGPIKGLVSMPIIVDQVVDGGADGIILNPGAARECATAYAGRCALIVRVTGASTDKNATFDYHRRISSVQQAVRLGADAVIAMGFVGGTGEAASLALLAQLAEECSQHAIPLIAEMLPAAPDRFQDAEWIAVAARVAYELGADIVKAYTTGTEEDAMIIGGCGLPFLAAGGPKSSDPVDIAESAIQHGAAGIAFGRNVFEAPSPRATVEALVNVVHRSEDRGQAIVR
ncbi:fructose-bisphosphate aldolase [Candidatus Bipolaricaulota bacterium]|nr:fructose-bisphosphate aldolase [Candidatus Bipolaricaulota bacterium]